MRYRWGDYRLDRQGTLLTRRGEQVDLSRKQLDGLTHLVEQGHRAAPYDELIRAIWGHDRVTHNQLSQVILSLRRLLGDDSQSQRLIRTLPGLGYRWVGEIVASEGAAAAPPQAIDAGAARDGGHQESIA